MCFVALWNWSWLTHFVSRYLETTKKCTFNCILWLITVKRNLLVFVILVSVAKTELCSLARPVGTSQIMHHLFCIILSLVSVKLYTCIGVLDKRIFGLIKELGMDTIIDLSKVWKERGLHLYIPPMLISGMCDGAKSVMCTLLGELLSR